MREIRKAGGVKGGDNVLFEDWTTGHPGPTAREVDEGTSVPVGWSRPRYRKTRRTVTTERPLPLGVTWDKSHGKYKAQIQVDGKRRHLGYFRTAEEASIAYQAVDNARPRQQYVDPLAWMKGQQ